MKKKKTETHVRFSIHGYRLEERPLVRKALYQALGVDRDELHECISAAKHRARLSSNYSDNCRVTFICTASQFVGFLVRRDRLGEQNLWKELYVEIVGEPEPREPVLDVTG